MRLVNIYRAGKKKTSDWVDLIRWGNLTYLYSLNFVTLKCQLLFVNRERKIRQRGTEKEEERREKREERREMREERREKREERREKSEERRSS